MLEVDFNGADDDGPKVLGTVRWDGRSLSYSYPEPLAPGEHDWLAETVQEPFGLPLEGRGVDPRTDPEDWIRSLHKFYRGSRFSASPARAVQPQPVTP